MNHLITKARDKNQKSKGLSNQSSFDEELEENDIEVSFFLILFFFAFVRTIICVFKNIFNFI